MAIPIVQLLLTALQANQQKSSSDQEKEMSMASENVNSIQQKRQQRATAAESILPQRGTTGLQGMDAMSPATSRQMQIFNNVVNRYRPQQQTGAMV